MFENAFDFAIDYFSNPDKVVKDRTGTKQRGLGQILDDQMIGKIVEYGVCKIIELNDFFNNKTSSKIKIDQDNLKIKLKNIWEKENVLNGIFSIEGHSYWDALKENFILLTTNRFIETVERFQLLEELFNQIKKKNKHK